MSKHATRSTLAAATLLGVAPVGCTTGSGGGRATGDEQPMAPAGDTGGTTTHGGGGDSSTGAPASDDGGDSGSTGAPAIDHSDEVDQWILSLGHLQIDPIEAAHEIDCDPMTMSCPNPWSDGDHTCNLQYYEETEQFDTFLALQPDSPALWPGAILRGGDAGQGTLSLVGLERAPATFSLSLENLEAAPLATMDSPSLSAFRAARNEILASGLHGSTPAQISYEISQVSTRSELSIHIGASVDWAGVLDFDAMFGFDDGQYQNRYLFDFTQAYYTVDLDTPSRPSDVFQDSVSVDDLKTYVGVDDPPMYVQSVVYGRRVLFAIESDHSLQDIVAAMDAAISGIVNLEGDVDATDTIESSKITAGILGGDGEAAAKTIEGIDELVDYIETGGNYSADSPGAPIAYRLAYLDNATGKLSLTAQYSQTVCQ